MGRACSGHGKGSELWPSHFALRHCNRASRMKMASRWGLDWAWNVTFEGATGLGFARTDAWDGMEQCLGIGMFGVFEELLRRSNLNDFS